MQTRIKNLLVNNSLFFAISLSLLVLVLSLVNTSNIPKLNLSHTDKLEHIFAYSVITFFWMLSHKLGKVNTSFIVLFILIVLFGIVIEFLQMLLTSNRVADFQDVIANIVGIIIGTNFLKLLRHLYLQV